MENGKNYILESVVHKYFSNSHLDISIAINKEIHEFEKRCMKSYLFKKSEEEKYSADKSVITLRQK